MQIASTPPPIVTNALPQDVVAKAVPNIQAMVPLIANAVAPSPKSEKFNQVRGDKEKRNREDHAERGEEDDPENGASSDGDRGKSVNISV
ncbi:MAG: hypothetical protein P4M13_01875 [Alphaproteobacteria bacterium]|nr:hypothetical protein [Alphaproteobacteria bacterium]